jgi:HK97 family phage portal protein
MRIFGLDISWSRKGQTLTLDQLIRNLEAAFETRSGVQVTPESAMESPTVHAVVRAIASRISTLPIHVYEKSQKGGRESKEPLPNHPVARLLSKPNDWQDRTTFWLDATSWLVRYGNFYAFKTRGVTGPIRSLQPFPPYNVRPEQQDDLSVVYKVHLSRGAMRDFTRGQLLHARGPSRDGIVGNSPIMDARESIALEIAAERFGGSFFANGAMPLMVFEFLAGSQGFKTEEDRQRFLQEFQEAYGQKKRFRALLLPRGLAAKDPIPLDNEKAQFLQTRKLQRTIIAGALGVPPHFVGDLERATFSNVEQQSLDFVQNVLLPYVRVFEAAMERDLLTDDDRAGGVIIRFNMDAALRGDFKTRQEGLKIQRESGVINPNEWREREGMNPREGGDEYWEEGPSGQGAKPAKVPAVSGNGDGEPVPVPAKGR